MFSVNYKVDYVSLNKRLNASFTRILRYLQETSLLQSADAGYTFEWFADRNRAWIITDWHVEVQRSPHWGEDISAMTAPVTFSGIVGERAFLIDDSSGNTIVKANSRWVFMDTENKKPVRFPKELVADYGPMTVLPLEKNYKIADYSAFNQVGRREFTVSRGDLDTNLHVNNCRYIEWAFDDIPDDVFCECYVSAMNASYKKECRRGDRILLETFRNPENHLEYAARITNLDLGATASEIHSIWKAEA